MELDHPTGSAHHRHDFEAAMRLPLLLALSLSLALPTASRATDRATALSQVPSGAQVRLTVEGREGTLDGRLLRSGADSLFVLPRSGGQELAVPLSVVGSFAYVDGLRPSPRKATVLGITLGIAGGAVLGVLAGQASGEGGGGGGGGGEGGGGADDARFSAAAVSAVTPAQAKATQDYRAVLGAVAGGLAGGLLGSLTGLGMTETRWTTVPVSTQPSSWNVAPAAPVLFAVRRPFGSKR